MKDLIIVRGGGDIATGTIYKLVKSGFHVLILEIAHPSAIRRNVAFSEAVYEEKWQVEDMTCHLAHDIKEAEQIMKTGNPALMIDPNGEMIKQLHPIAVVDAILAKKNLCTTRDMAPITIALDPICCRQKDVDVVVRECVGIDSGRIMKRRQCNLEYGIPESGSKVWERTSDPFSSRRNFVETSVEEQGIGNQRLILGKIERTPDAETIDVPASMMDYCEVSNRISIQRQRTRLVERSIRELKKSR